MPLFECKACQFVTTLKTNYKRHCKTQKHQRNIKNVITPEDHLKMENQQLKEENYKIRLDFAKRETELTKDKYESILRERDKRESMQKNQIINQVTQNIDNSKHINFLNIVLPDMISLSQFITNLQTTHQLKPEQTKQLLDNHHINVQSYGQCLSQTLRENCYEQLLSNQTQIPGNVRVLPLIKIDKDTHKEKSEDEWQTANDDQKIDELIYTANNQVYDHHQSSIDLDKDEFSIVRSRIKEDNDIDQIKQSLEHSMQQSIENIKTNNNNQVLSITNNTTSKRPVYSSKSRKREIVDCGLRYYLIEKNKQVFTLDEPHDYVGVYTHDENCPCGKSMRKDYSASCWYYVKEDQFSVKREDLKKRSEKECI